MQGVCGAWWAKHRGGSNPSSDRSHSSQQRASSLWAHVRIAVGRLASKRFGRTKELISFHTIDPQPELGKSPSKRGMGFAFGPDYTDAFLTRNNLQLLIRSHEVGWNIYYLDRWNRPYRTCSDLTRLGEGRGICLGAQWALHHRLLSAELLRPDGQQGGLHPLHRSCGHGSHIHLLRERAAPQCAANEICWKHVLLLVRSGSLDSSQPPSFQVEKMLICLLLLLLQIDERKWWIFIFIQPQEGKTFVQNLWLIIITTLLLTDK